MKTTFYIASRAVWDRAQALVLAKEHVRAGYDVSVFEHAYHTSSAEDGVYIIQPLVFAQNRVMRAVWVWWRFFVQRRGIVHVFGAQNGMAVFAIRVLHPFSRIIAHIDDIQELSYGLLGSFSRGLTLRLAHVSVTSRKDLLQHEALLDYDPIYLPYAIATRSQVVDSTLLRAHNVELQRYVLAHVNPDHWMDVEYTVKSWREHIRSNMSGATLVVVFTHDAPSAHIAFGHDVVVLGAVTSYVMDGLYAGACAVIVPHLGYRFEMMKSMAIGKYVAPLRELINRNPFALDMLAHMYGESGHAIVDLADPAIMMSWGHVARHIIGEEHSPAAITAIYEDMYRDLFFAQRATTARIS